MNDINPVIWNINASLFQSEQTVRELAHLVATLRRQLVAEQKACLQLRRQLCDFAERLRDYAEALPLADTSPREKGTR